MPTEILDGLVQQRLAHSKVLYLPDDGLLVDTGPASAWSDLSAFLDERDGVDRVFLSHAHGDHVGNADRVRDRYDPEILFPANEPLADTPLTADEVERVGDGDEIADGVHVVEVPGHTEGICALHLPEERTLLGTDVLDGSDRRGLPPGHLLPPPATYNWDSEQAEENLHRLLDREFDRVVVTHGSNVEEDAHRKLDAYLNFPDYYRKDLLEE